MFFFARLNKFTAFKSLRNLILIILLGLKCILMGLIQREDLSGVYHWSDGASISWYEFAEQIKSCAIRQGCLNVNCRLRPVSTSDYPTKAQRPKYSVLDRSAIMDHLNIDKTEWQSELYKVISKIKSEG